jgi:hypothetical protein
VRQYASLDAILPLDGHSNLSDHVIEYELAVPIGHAEAIVWDT